MNSLTTEKSESAVLSITSESLEHEYAIGEELKCEEVDMSDPKLDPLEWSVRKAISIPRVYYWETENYSVSLRTKVWHRTIQTMGITLRCAEKMGEVASNVLGLNSSRYSDVTDFMTDEEWKEAKERAVDDKAKRNAYLQDQAVKKNKINVV